MSRYLTYTEWTTLYGGKLEAPEKEPFRRLPFNYCCVSLQPFQHPYCDEDGNMFELEAVMEYYQKYKHNPVTGKVTYIHSKLRKYETANINFSASFDSKDDTIWLLEDTIAFKLKFQYYFRGNQEVNI